MVVCQKLKEKAKFDNRVAYELSPDDNGTKLTVTQDNILSQESKAHSQKNWEMVLEKIKELLEK